MEHAQKRTIFLTWYRKLKKRWVEPGCVASKTSRFYGNVKYNTNMTTLPDKTTVQKMEEHSGQRNTKMNNTI